jgi:hypothetical protein
MDDQLHTATRSSTGDFDLSATEAFNGQQHPALPAATMQADAMTVAIYHNPHTANESTPQPRSYYHAELKFPCDFAGCGRKFRSPHNVQQHVRAAHTGERPFACSLCEEKGKQKAFVRLASLYRHIRGVHKMDVDFTRGKGVRKVSGRRQEPTSTTAASYELQQHQPLGMQMPMHGSDHRANSESPDQREGASQMTIAGGGLFGQPVQSADLADVQVHDAKMPMLVPCLYDDCTAYIAAHDVEAHGHAFHGVPHSPHCGCVSCQNIFSNESMYHHQQQQQQHHVLAFDRSATYGSSYARPPLNTYKPIDSVADQGFEFDDDHFIDYGAPEDLSGFLSVGDRAYHGSAAHHNPSHG